MEVVRVLEKYRSRIRKRAEIARYGIVPFRLPVVFKSENDILAGRGRQINRTGSRDVRTVPRFPGRNYYRIAGVGNSYHSKERIKANTKSTTQSMKIATRKAPVTHIIEAKVL